LNDVLEICKSTDAGGQTRIDTSLRLFIIVHLIPDLKILNLKKNMRARKVGHWLKFGVPRLNQLEPRISQIFESWYI
jgi:hypothetical protein